jgi:hypothetical protein
MNEKVSIQLYKRPWYEWVLWAIWIFLLIFIGQNAFASGNELEPRAATIFWMSFIVLLLGGLIVWFVRRAQLSK